MAFWWQRRRRWYTRKRTPWRRRRRRAYYRRPRRRFRRSRYRRPATRRRRRRRTKVKRKKKFLKLLQWQPDSIRKCKVKGIDILLLGYNGTQSRNYTTVMNRWTYPRTPSGGGFSTTVFSLQFLYEQYELRKNIWTHSNLNYDLCRYTGCRFKFYRHPWADFVLSAKLMYPMTLNFNDYMNTQPLQLLLQRKHFVVPSFKNKPNGKPYITKYFKPPKQMTNKWFFQNSFSEKPLLLLTAAVCNLQQPFLGPQGENEGVTLTCINIQSGYINGDWGAASSTGYYPVKTYTPTGISYKPKSSDSAKTLTFPTGSPKNTVTYSAGWFSKEILKAWGVQFSSAGQYLPPTYEARYNPKTDTGKGNIVWLSSVSTDHYNPPQTDKILQVREQPLWLLLFGLVDYIQQLKKLDEFEKIYYLLIQSDFIKPKRNTSPHTTHLIIDSTFTNGLGPFASTPTDHMLLHWYPTLEQQQQSITNIVLAGPFTYKTSSTQNNWELHYKYCFYFKWGGAQDNNKQITDPSKHSDYPTPNPEQQAIQIADPRQQIPESLLHSWDFRRGYLTKSALKRMYEYLPTEQIIPTDSELPSPQKKIKFSCQTPHLQEESTEETCCLQTLFKESTCQEIPQEEISIKQLIQQQQQQQQTIKHNLLLLLSQLKNKQLELQLHSGLLE
nr:MAG: ORF1 [Torque teno midi virus]